MSYPENTTQQLHYPAEGYGVDESTTQAHLRMPSTQPDPAAGRMPMAAPTELAAPPRPASGPGRGLTTIAEDVVERVIQKVVDLTVEEVDGVHGLRPGVDQFFQPAPKPVGQAVDKPADGGAEAPAGAGPAPAAAGERAVTVSLADGQATINLAIEVDFGFAVLDVVEQVRSTVIEQAERLLGLTVAEVNVVVSEVSFDASAAAAGSDKPVTARKNRS